MRRNRDYPRNVKLEFTDEDGPTVGEIIREAEVQRFRRLRRIKLLGLCAIVASVFTIVLSQGLFAGYKFHWIVATLDAMSLLLFALGFTILIVGPWWVYFRNRAA